MWRLTSLLQESPTVRAIYMKKTVSLTFIGQVTKHTIKDKCARFKVGILWPTGIPPRRLKLLNVTNQLGCCLCLERHSFSWMSRTVFFPNLFFFLYEVQNCRLNLFFQFSTWWLYGVRLFTCLALSLFLFPFLFMSFLSIWFILTLLTFRFFTFIFLKKKRNSPGYFSAGGNVAVRREQGWSKVGMRWERGGDKMGVP